MPLTQKRLFRLIALNTVIVIVLVLSIVLAKKIAGHSSSTVSERILTTPEVETTSPTTPLVQPTETIQPSPQPSPREVLEPTGPIDIKKLRAKNAKVSVHAVELGENYWSIASDNDIDIYTLIGANPDLPFKASLGHPVNILSQRGVLHVVTKGEDTRSISALYKIDEKSLKNENGISWWHGLNTGDVLFVPNAKPIVMNGEWKNYFSRRGIFGVPFANWGKGWTSGFGWRTDPITGERRIHKGVDFRAKYGDSVFAAGSGKVIFAGVSGGYGNLIQIKHPNGYITMYGHLSKIFVKAGHKVRRGELIGRVGATGRVTGPHLHFEIRKNGVAIDPMLLI